jgi:two-component system, LuxR family, sensor kinase FixL
MSRISSVRERIVGGGNDHPHAASEALDRQPQGRKRARSPKMRSSSDHDLLDSLVEHTGMLVMGIEPTGAIRWMSRGLEVMCGYAQEEVMGRDWVQLLVPPEHQAATKVACRGSQGGDRTHSHVKPLTCRDGTLRQIEWFHSDIRDSSGNYTGILCVGRDITELQKTRDALSASERRSSLVLETAVNAIITMNDERIIETVNHAATRIFGYTKEEMIGQNIKMLMPQPYKSQHDGYVAKYLQTGVRKIIGVGREVVGQRKDGSIFPIDLSVGEAHLPDGSRVFTGIIRDLTDRKQLEEKLLHISEEEQHRIGQDIHDDLCQQLAAIGCLAKVAHQQLSKAGRTESTSLQEIVQLVTQANVRAREMSRGLMPVVLDSAGLMAALRELAQGTERIFRVSCPFRCDQPVQVMDNKVATQLFRIAQEAVANAIKHSRADRIEISLNRELVQLSLSIRDNGVGIPDNVRGERTGMGLLTMSHRARMLGGTVTVSADENGGTIVQCTVPLAPSTCPFS